jgi:hypothetical protein
VIVINWDALANSIVVGCITGSAIGVVTGLTNWLLNRQILRRLEKFEESHSKPKGEN